MVELRLRSGPAVGIVLAGLVGTITGCTTQLDRAEVTVGRHSYRVEVARTGHQQQQGLGGRTSVPADTGMLFDFSARGVQKVWMADTRVPLDAAWIVDDAVLAVRTMQPCKLPDQSTCPTWTAPGPVDALLEVPAGSLTDVVRGTPVRVRDLDR